MSGPVAELERRIATGTLVAEPAQRRAAEALQELHDRLATPRRRALDRGFFRARFGKPRPVERGLYIYGPVGRGKSMLMDLFFAAAPRTPKRRVHFHAFMQDVHDLVHRWRKGDRDWAPGRFGSDDPVPPVAARLAQDARLLCFDEFQVTDVADAMLLGRLFTALFEQGVVVVATSNVAPDRLYEGGLNRQLFLPFIGLLKYNMEVCHLSSPTDWRLEGGEGKPSYYTPLGAEADTRMNDAWHAMTAASGEERKTLSIKGRKLLVPRATDDAARFSFAELCERPLGTPDYLALAGRFAVIFIDNIPILPPERRNEARRLIHLIDALYDHRVRLVCSAAAQPRELYPVGDGKDMFGRTASRLVEMTAPEWPSVTVGIGASTVTPARPVP